MPTLKVWDGSAWIEVKGDKGDPGEVTNADLESRVSPIEGDVSAIDTRVTTVEMETAEVVTVSDRLSTQRFDTRAFPSVQDAIDTAHAAGGGEVFIGENPPPGLNLVLRDGVYLTGRGIGATRLNINTIVGEGSITPLPGLSGSLQKNSRMVGFSNAHGLAPGDVFVIYDTEDSSFSSARSYYRAGEFCRVRSVINSVNVATTKPLYDAYSSGTEREIYKLNPIRTGISNMTIECTEGETGIKITYGMDLEFSNLRMSGTNISHLTLSRCYSTNISRISVFHLGSLVSANYGITIANSQRIRISDVDLETHRHGLTTGGDNAVCSVPNRDIIVSDSYINGMVDNTQAGVCGANLHGNTEFVRFSNCTFPSGANPAGDNIEFDSCTFGTAAWGGALDCMEMLGVNLSIRNCKFTITDDFQSARSPVYLYFGPSTARTVGNLIVDNNEFDLGSAVSDGATHRPVYIQMHSSSGTSALRRAYVRNNVFEALTTTSRGAIRIATTGTDMWQGIDYTANSGRLAHLVEFSSAGTLVRYDGWGAGVPSFAAAAGSRYQRSANPGTGFGELYLNKNGDATWTKIA